MQCTREAKQGQQGGFIPNRGIHLLKWFIDGYVGVSLHMVRDEERISKAKNNSNPLKISIRCPKSELKMTQHWCNKDNNRGGQKTRKGLKQLTGTSLHLWVCWPTLGTFFTSVIFCLCVRLSVSHFKSQFNVWMYLHNFQSLKQSQ